MLPTNEHLAQILETVGDAVVVVDREQVIRMVNGEAERVFGFSKDELVGADVTLVMPVRYRKTHDDAFEKRLADSSPMPLRTIEVEARRKDGSEFPIQVRFTRTIVDGHVLFTAAVRDVTEQVAAREEIQRLKDALERERDYLREEVREAHGVILGTSPALRRVLGQVDAVAGTDATVLIEGESGVGKELIARAIHERSRRADGPLVKVNCASVPKELFESEFFGHVRGAFTGAHKDRIGRFQLADGGTLFLDEVGEIPIDLQGKLLRVLQEQELERVGDDETRKVDVRVVAATNRDLEQEAGAGRFRTDLYYRLSVFPIAVPALRDRREDVPELARHFLQRCSARLKREPVMLSEADERRLQEYDWPGNVRELQNVIERAAILAVDGRLSLEHALPQKTNKPPNKELDREAIEAALASASGNVSQAARTLGLSRQALYRRMKSFGISA